VQSLHMGRDRQCRTHPKQAASSELVKIAPSICTDVGMKKGALHQSRKSLVPDMLSTGSWDCRFKRRSWSAQPQCANVIRQPYPSE
jgi:hypothetical protein